ncbi:MAG: hypothetical protein DRI36_05030, partial [Caldiserica bacterium]
RLKLPNRQNGTFRAHPCLPTGYNFFSEIVKEEDYSNLNILNHLLSHYSLENNLSDYKIRIPITP